MDKSVLRITFKGDIFAHYVIDSHKVFYVDDKTPLNDIKCYLKYLPEVVLCPESFDDVIGITFFSLCNDVEV